MATTVQVVNISEYRVQFGASALPSPYRSTAFTSGAASVDLATLSNIGRRDLQRLVAEGKVLVLKDATIS